MHDASFQNFVKDIDETLIFYFDIFIFSLDRQEAMYAILQAESRFMYRREVYLMAFLIKMLNI